MGVTTKIVVLYEHATGYALFTVTAFEEVATMLPDVEASIKVFANFGQRVKLMAFSPFKTGTNALDNCNSISEGIMHEDLQTFLQVNIKSGKDITVGVGDQKLGASINEGLGYSVQHGGVVPEVLRGLRQHFPRFISALTDVSASKAQLGLAHSYSRCKIKFNVHRTDNMIIQSISLLDQIDKDVNTFSMRCREWYSYHFPELIKICSDNLKFAKLVSIIGDRKAFSSDRIGEVEEVVGDSGIAQAIIDASKSSMGMDISPLDLVNIEMFSKKVVSLVQYRQNLAHYLHTKMEQCAPNVAALIGDTVGARLISHAGSLTNLSKCPASTVQILGAEKALFRALKTRTNTPKYGLIYHSSYIGKADAKFKGRIARCLANKTAIASRIDCYSEFPTTVFGEAMKQQVEDRLHFYTTGELPQKNVDVMSAATKEATVVQGVLAKKAKKQKKKAQKAAKAAAQEAAEDTITEANRLVEGSRTEKKKKKKRKHEEVENGENVEPKVQQEEASPVKKKKKVKKQKADI